MVLVRCLWRNVWKRSGLTEKSLLPVPLEIHTVFAPDCQEVVFFTCVFALFPFRVGVRGDGFFLRRPQHIEAV